LCVAEPEDSGLLHRTFSSRTGLNFAQFSYFLSKCVRVDLGGCPPRSPTGPDVWNYLIRFLQLRFRCVT